MMKSSSLLKNNLNYRVWFIGDSASSFGSQLTSMAFVLLSYAVTQDLIQASLVGATNAAAQFLVMLPGGFLVDRFPKLKLLKLYAILKMLCMVLLCILILTGSINFLWLLSIACVSGLLSGTFGGLTNALLPFIVRGESLRTALIANESRDSIISVGSAPIGGALFGFAWHLPFLVDAVSYLALFWSATRINAVVDAEEQAEHGERFFARLFGGIRWVLSRVDISLILLVLTVSNIGNFLAIASIELQLQKDGQPGWIIGLVFSFFSAGMVVGGFCASRLQKLFTPFCVVSLAFTAQCAGYLLMSFTSAWFAIAFVMFLVTIPVIALNSVLGAYQMQQTPDSLQGRVGTVFMFVIGIGPVITGAGAGVLLQFFGWQPALLIASACCALSLIVSVLSKSIRSINT